MSERVLITGGAGYVGTSLIPLLLKKNYHLTIYDSLLFKNGEKLLPYISNPNFNFIKADIRDVSLLKKHISNYDIIIHLAAYVGYGICREKGEKESHEVNAQATKNLVSLLSKDQYLLYGSTGSNYGEVEGLCVEETPLNPLSIYGRTKTEGEKYVMERENSTAYRFATAFGLSSRLRLDLLVNDLTFKALSEKYAVIYESHFLRTFIHVHDMSRSFLFAMENQHLMKNNVYNVGDDSMNYSKKEACEIIQSNIPDVLFHYADIGEDVDKRNYQVSYKKINSLGFNTIISLDEGIKELIKAFRLIYIQSPFHNS